MKKSFMLVQQRMSILEMYLKAIWYISERDEDIYVHR
jgi:hypothetical protein